MKATNSYEDMEVHRVPMPKVPNICRERPRRFNKYTWTSQNGRVLHTHEMDDRHLINLYNMLMNTLVFARKQAMHIALRPKLQQVIKRTGHELRYIGHEVYLRNMKELDEVYNEAKTKYHESLRELSG